MRGEGVAEDEVYHLWRDVSTVQFILALLRALFVRAKQTNDS